MRWEEPTKPFATVAIARHVLTAAAALAHDEHKATYDALIAKSRAEAEQEKERLRAQPWWVRWWTAPNRFDLSNFDIGAAVVLSRHRAAYERAARLGAIARTAQVDSIRIPEGDVMLLRRHLGVLP